MPKETFTHSAVAHVSRDAAWLALDNPTTWESIAGVDRIHDPVFDENGRLLSFSFETMVAGLTYRGNATPRERVDGEVMAWDIKSPDIRGYTEVRLTDNEDHTLVTITVQVETVGFLASMFFPAISGAVGRGLPSAVEEFAASLSKT